MDGYSYGLNWGLIGVGSDSARGTFDNVAVQVLAPEATTVRTDNFDAAPGTLVRARPPSAAGPPAAAASPARPRPARTRCS